MPWAPRALALCAARGYSLTVLTTAREQKQEPDGDWEKKGVDATENDSPSPFRGRDSNVMP